MATTANTARAKLGSGPSRHVYDVIVVGGQLGGALAAALLAKRGLHVLLVEHDGLGPGYEHGGFLLPYAPFVAPSIKMMPLVEECFTELGLTTTIQRTLRPHKPELQLVLERHRVDLNAEEERRKAELAREFGDEGQGLLTSLNAAAAQHEATDAFFKEGPELPPDGMMEAWQLKRQMKLFPQLDDSFRLDATSAPSRLLRGLLPFLVHLDKPTESPLASTRALSQTLRAPCRYPGGREGFREALCKRISELGGDLVTRESSDNFVAEELSFDGGKFAGIKLVRSDTLYRAGCLVAATDSGALRRLIHDKKKHRGLVEHLDGSSTRSFLFTVNWVLPVQAIPRGMGELVLLDAEDPELGPLLIQQHPARRTEDGKEDDNSRVICTGAFVNASARELGEKHLQELTARIEEHLDALMPFAREQARVRSAPYLDAGGVRGSRLLPHPLYQFEGGETYLGVTGLKQRTPVKNVVLAGREVLPGLGLEGEFLAGIRAAKLVQEVLGKKQLLG